MKKHIQVTKEINIDVILFLLSVSRRYNMDYEFTNPLYMIESTWAVPPKQQLPHFIVIFRAFPLYVWLALFVTMIILIISLYVFSLSRVLNMNLADCFFRTAKLLIAVDLRIPNRSTSFRIFAVFALFFAAHMNLFYNCSLTSIQTKPMLVPNPSNLEELIDSGIGIRTVEGTFGFVRLPENGTAVKKMRKNTQIDRRNNLNKIFIEYLRNPNCAVLTTSVQYLLVKNRNDLEAIDERVRQTFKHF